MPGRIARVVYPALLTLGLGYAVSQDGGVYPVGWYTCVLILSLTSLTYWVFRPSSDIPRSLSPWLSRALVVLLAYVTLQLVPLPLFLVRLLSPARARLTETLALVLPSSGWTPLSVAPTVTVSYLLQGLAFALGFLLIRELTWWSRAWWPWAPLLPLVIIAVAEAVAGLQQNADGATVAGTYLNKDHYAGLLEMVFPAAVACGIAFSVRQRFAPQSLIRSLTGAAFLLAATAIFVAIIYSLAKMGFLATLFALFIVGALELNARLRPGRKWIGIASAGVIILCLLILLPPAQLVAALGNVFVDDTTGEGRLPIWADTTRLVAAYPVFGVGLGNYGSAFPKYQTNLVDSALTFTHNDYLELISELGIPMFLLLAGSAVLVFRKAWRAATSSTNRATHYLALACTGGMAAIGLHSLVDFNLYLPANAMVLVWLAAISTVLPDDSVVPAAKAARPSRFLMRTGPIAISVALAIFASAWLIFLQRGFKDQAGPEQRFCRFGICDIDSVLAADKAAHEGDVSSAPLPDLIEAARRDPASPGRWSDLGGGFLKQGQADSARKSFANALQLGPNIPPVLLETAGYRQEIGDDDGALALTSRALSETIVFRPAIFDWFAEKNLPVADVLSRGLPANPEVFRAYLETLISGGGLDDVVQAWAALASHGYVDEKTVLDYTSFLFSHERYQDAAEALANFSGSGDPAYLKSNWIFNGDFESDFSKYPFDWSLRQGDGVEFARDSDVHHSGKYSLRIRFTGEQNLANAHLGNRAYVSPGKYRFEAFVRTDRISTDQGIRIRVSDSSARIDFKTEPLLGTHDWKKVSATFCVAAPAKLLSVSVIRQPSLKFDNLLKGTLWMDSVTLTRTGQSCSP